jgi:hypothetical protein
MVKRSMGLSALLSTALVATFSAGALAQVRGPGGESFVLSGLIIFEAGGGLAYLQEPSLTGDRSVALRVSESIGPYRLTRILEDRVVLEGPSGTVLVPVLNSGGGGSGTAVAASSGRATRAGAADASAEAATPVATSATQADTSGMRGLRDRLEIARRQVEMLQRNPQSADYRLGRQPAEHAAANPTPNATLSSSQTSAASNQNGGPQNPGTQNPNALQNGGSTQTGGNANVVYPPRRQTFQSILGLK